VPTLPALRIVPLEPGLEPAWQEFVSRRANSLFYASLEYRDLVARVLGATPHYLVAIHGQEVRGVLPSFAATDASLGTVLNSLPYYGANGGIITDGSAEAGEALLGAYLQLEQSLGCAASTLIASPHDGALNIYEKDLGCTFRDSRIGQLTRLPRGSARAEDELFGRYDESARRNVRKARKSGVTFRESNSEEDLRFLHRTHRDNILQVGGLPKDWSFFEAVPKPVSKGSWSVWVAEKDGEPIAALLLFRFNSTVEYYTPAVVEAFRPLQALALLVHEAMCLAAREGFEWWNWGGTWASQEGVYRFKKKWGAQDKLYYYYCRLADRQVLHASRQALLEAFPGFFVVPFDKLIPESSVA
jgi:hypothetical protein